MVKLFLAIPFIIDRIQSFFYRKSFKICGSNVYLRPSSSDFKGLENMSIGNNVSIPKGAVIYSTKANLTIKDNVIFGPRPTIITGDHRIDVIGTPIIHSHEKTPENDMDVTIEEDVWFGANIVLLKGVTIGRGSVVAAGAVVNKSCPPYSIIAGVPAKVIKYRFSIEEALEHESKIYHPENRYTKQYLEQSRL
ncbi:acyltransferase [Muribaculum intestinale]|uniref:acyltransferase n=1 Tax=Muribaculum intestinale TaxID=1796646 RepID=UPI00248D0095|nr:acyltransferase [Muribaculum intestinale]